ncbi:MAG TPA: hypothetical protein DEH22_17480 [Chloroflexi bacterium]|nr:hypothetical protein [Chloroflexota bacterium]
MRRSGLNLKNITKVVYPFIKHLYSSLYNFLLPVLVHPPGKIYRGAFYTFTRINIIEFLESWQDKIHGKVLDVGVGMWEYPRQLFADRCEYTTTDCFEGANVDVVSNIHQLTASFSSSSFDFVICTDVLEHVERPWIAIKELHSLLKSGGILLLTVPFNYYLHGNEYVKDYWRFTADGLQQLLVQEAGFLQVTIIPIGHQRFPFSYQIIAQK